MKISIVVPTLNAAKAWERFISALLNSVAPPSVLIIDSESTDGTVNLARSAGFRVHTIGRSDFNHGGTRQLAAELLSDAEVLVFLTQDVVLADSSALARMLACFADPNIAAAFGRQ